MIISLALRKAQVVLTLSILSVRTIVNHFIDGGSAANLCTIDLSKAFDKVNHHVLFIKLMKRKLLDLLVHWLENCFSRVKWDGILSHVFKLDFGVRQGSVSPPFLFAIYLDDLIDFPRIVIIPTVLYCTPMTLCCWLVQFVN